MAELGEILPIGQIMLQLDDMTDEYNGPLQAKFQLLQANLNNLAQMLDQPIQELEHPPAENDQQTTAVRVAALMDHLRDFKRRVLILRHQCHLNHTELQILRPVIGDALLLLLQGRVIARLHWVRLLSALELDDLETARRQRDWMGNHQIEVPEEWLQRFPAPIAQQLEVHYLIDVLQQINNNIQVIIDNAEAEGLPNPFTELEELFDLDQMDRFMAQRPWQRQQPQRGMLNEELQVEEADEEFAHDFIDHTMIISRVYYRIQFFADGSSNLWDVIQDPVYSGLLMAELQDLANETENGNEVAQLLLLQFLELWVVFRDRCDTLCRARTIYRLHFIRYYFAVQAQYENRAQIELEWMQNHGIDLPPNGLQLEHNLIQNYPGVGHTIQEETDEEDNGDEEGGGEEGDHAESEASSQQDDPFASDFEMGNASGSETDEDLFATDFEEGNYASVTETEDGNQSDVTLQNDGNEMQANVEVDDPYASDTTMVMGNYASVSETDDSDIDDHGQQAN